MDSNQNLASYHVTQKGGDVVTRSYSRGYPDMVSVTQTREDFVTQLSPGEMVCHARAVNTSGASLIGLWERPECIGGTVLQPEMTGVLMPLSWDGDFVINGHSLVQGEAYSVDSPDGFISRGKNRYLFGLQVDRALLLDTLAALTGLSREDVVLTTGPLYLGYCQIAWIAQRLQTQLHNTESQNVESERKAYQLLSCSYQTMLEIHLSATQQLERPISAWRRATRIVRQAEDRFAACQCQAVSLADLCIAASVSSSTLYMAFEQVAGLPPLRYFKVRRLNLVNEKLAKTSYRRGAVAELATAHGFTELGRFSVEYKKLFGVSPSITLAAD